MRRLTLRLTDTTRLSLVAFAVLLVLAIAALPRAGLVPRTVDYAPRWQTELSGTGLTVAKVEAAFAELQYDFAAAKSGGQVPRVLVRAVPADMSEIPEVDRRKALFLASVLPLVLAVNEEIAAERVQLLAIDAKLRRGETLSAAEADTLDRLGRAYGLIEDDLDESQDAESAGDPPLAPSVLAEALRRRIAPVPVSLALAQAAEESAWGQSRFAAQGNALYGQWVWNDAKGIIPAARAATATHSVRAFPDLLEATRTYARNLNTHWAYADFRSQRHGMISAGETLDGAALAGSLLRYSERGADYVHSLRTIIAGNGLSGLDGVRFAAPDMRMASAQ